MNNYADDFGMWAEDFDEDFLDDSFDEDFDDDDDYDDDDSFVDYYDDDDDFDDDDSFADDFEVDDYDDDDAFSMADDAEFFGRKAKARRRERRMRRLNRRLKKLQSRAGKKPRPRVVKVRRPRSDHGLRAYNLARKNAAVNRVQDQKIRANAKAVASVNKLSRANDVAHQKAIAAIRKKTSQIEKNAQMTALLSMMGGNPKIEKIKGNFPGLNGEVTVTGVDYKSDKMSSLLPLLMMGGMGGSSDGGMDMSMLLLVMAMSD